MGGHFEVLKWLRAEGCPWYHETCFYAVEKGHVEVLRWARENGCPWDPWTRDKAAAKLGYTDDLGNLVDEVGDPLDEDDEANDVPVFHVIDEDIVFDVIDEDIVVE